MRRYMAREIYKQASILLFLVFCIGQYAAQIHITHKKNIPAALDKKAVMLASFGEMPLLAKMLSLWIHSYDSRSGMLVPYHHLDYTKLIAWLDVICALDPQSSYALLTAARVFSEVKDINRKRMIIEFIHQKYLEAPAKRWRWQAEAVLIAKHRLRDLPLARALAQGLIHVDDRREVPYWVKDIQHLLLAEMGEFEAAITLISSMLQSGIVSDPNEIRFLTQKLKILQHESRLKDAVENPTEVTKSQQ